MEKAVEKTMIQYQMVQPGDLVVAGVSGGPDSMALLNVLWKLHRRMGFALMVAHINHMLRGDASDQDEELVLSFCETRAIDCRSLQVDVEAEAKKQGRSVEETGRMIRYDFYRSLLADGRAGRIATGHHREDQVETILMRILRGTGVKGLRGMEPTRQDVIIRPLLFLSKEEIVAYCQQEKIPYHDDVTNFHEQYHRNRLRLHLIPLLKEYNPAIDAALLRLSESAVETEQFLHTQTAQAWTGCNGAAGLDVETFLMLEPLMQKRVLLMAVEEATNGGGLEQRHVDGALAKIREKDHTVWTLDWPDGIRLRRSYNILRVEEKTPSHESERFEYAMVPGKVYGFPRLGMVVETRWTSPEIFFKKPQKSDEFFLDYDKMIKISGTLILRQRKPGDRMWSSDGSLGRKVKKTLIDQKIPRSQRDELVCLTVGHGIVWIPGVAMSTGFAVTKETRKILHIIVNKFQEEAND
jgi:tRNA(Ile)-lysidine synthase